MRWRLRLSTPPPPRGGIPGPVPPELFTTTGEPLPLGELVDLAAAPATVPAARERLAGLGIRTTAATAAPTS
ncbi:hypothetical protein ACIG87_29845 [Micromonospora sp. NPDC051925]|uniref:hypothetical protein n=1 Tax=Micromonospora sp. NPDC051925 TaxID=3364288 RepID=UPI0037C602CE